MNLATTSYPSPTASTSHFHLPTRAKQADTSYTGGDHMVTTVLDVRVVVRLKNEKTSDFLEIYGQDTHRIWTDDLLIINHLAQTYGEGPLEE
jgi:hypothetical protein